MRVFMLKRNSASVAHSIVSMYFLQMKLCLCIQGLLVHDNHLPSLGVTKILIQITNVEKATENLFSISFLYLMKCTILLLYNCRGFNQLRVMSNNTPFLLLLRSITSPGSSWSSPIAGSKERETASYHDLRWFEIALRMSLREKEGRIMRRREVGQRELKAGAVEVCMAAGSSPAIISKRLNTSSYSLTRLAILSYFAKVVSFFPVFEVVLLQPAYHIYV